MNASEVAAVEKCYDKLSKSMEIDEVINYLIIDKILDPERAELFRNKEELSTTRRLKLLEYLKHKNGAFEALVNALNACGQNFLAKLLLDGLIDTNSNENTHQETPDSMNTSEANETLKTRIKKISEAVWIIMFYKDIGTHHGIDLIFTTLLNHLDIGMLSILGSYLFYLDVVKHRSTGYEVVRYHWWCLWWYGCFCVFKILSVNNRCKWLTRVGSVGFVIMIVCVIRSNWENLIDCFEKALVPRAVGSSFLVAARQIYYLTEKWPIINKGTLFEFACFGALALLFSFVTFTLIIPQISILPSHCRMLLFRFEFLMILLNSFYALFLSFLTPLVIRLISYLRLNIPDYVVVQYWETIITATGLSKIVLTLALLLGLFIFPVTIGSLITNFFSFWELLIGLVFYFYLSLAWIIANFAVIYLLLLRILKNEVVVLIVSIISALWCLYLMWCLVNYSVYSGYIFYIAISYRFIYSRIREICDQHIGAIVLVARVLHSARIIHIGLRPMSVKQLLEYCTYEFYWVVLCVNAYKIIMQVVQNPRQQESQPQQEAQSESQAPREEAQTGQEESHHLRQQEAPTRQEESQIILQIENSESEDPIELCVMNSILDLISENRSVPLFKKLIRSVYKMQCPKLKTD